MIFHGFNEHCKGKDNGEYFADHVAEVTGAHAECVEVDAPFDDPTQAQFKSVFNNFVHYTEAACAAVRANPNFNSGEFNLIGISQGSLVARNLVENCPDLHVRNLWTIGGPHRGVNALPNCYEGIRCEVETYLVNNGVYTQQNQQSFNPASYWRDPLQLDIYLQQSIFLPYLNNEKDFKQERKDQILKLNHAVFTATDHDEVVYPRESALFGEIQIDGSVWPKELTDLWLNDLLGLKQLTEEGRATWIMKEGEHIEFSYGWFDRHIFPFLIHLKTYQSEHVARFRGLTFTQTSAQPKGGGVNLGNLLCSPLLLAGEDLPESQRFVTSSSYNGLAIRAHGKVEDAEGVALEGGDLLHGGAAPDDDGVVGVAVSGDELVGVLGEEEVADLRAGFNAARLLHLERVPEADTAVGSASARSEDSVLQRIPGQCFHSGQVRGELARWFLLLLERPHAQLVVVAARGQLLLVVAPLQATHFLLVRLQFRKEVALLPWVSLQDVLVPRSRREHP